MEGFEKIDPKFKFNDKAADGAMDYYAIPDPAFEMRGIGFYGAEGFLRMPKEVGESVSPEVAVLNHHTSGGRLLFSTDSSVLEISVTYDYLSRLRNIELSALGFVLIERCGSERRYIKIMPPDYKDDTGYTFSVELEGGMRDYILYFPVVGRVRTLTVGLTHGSEVRPLKIYDGAPIYYYGSSISQGFCAGRADNTYEAFIEKWSERDFVNLGFSGSGKGEDAMIEYLCSVDASAFVCDFNHSGMDLELFKKQHRRLYERFRATPPTTPILILSKTCMYVGLDNIEEHERACTQEKIIYDTYLMAKESGDENVYFISGVGMLSELSPTDRMSAMNDSDHPNELGFYIMAKKIYEVLKNVI